MNKMAFNYVIFVIDMWTCRPSLHNLVFHTDMGSICFNVGLLNQYINLTVKQLCYFIYTRYCVRSKTDQSSKKLLFNMF